MLPGMAAVKVNLDFGGSSRAGQTVAVYQHGTQTAASVFGPDGVTPATQPLTVAPNGHLYFAVAAGTYDVVGPDLTRTIVVSNPVAGTGAEKYVNDLIGNQPTPAVYGVGWYFATDQNGGTLWYSDGTSWTKVTAGLNWASGTQLAYAELTNASPVVSATAAADINAALTITVPASNVPVKIQGRILGQQVTGASAAVGSFNQLVVALTDAANNTIEFDVLPAIQASLASKTWYHTFNVEARLPAPFAGGTYKLRTYLTAALATGWSAALQATTPTWPKAFIEAVAE